MSQTLCGYEPNHPVSDEARRAYGGILPLLMDYLVEEFVPQHVEERRRDPALKDLWERVNELLEEARANIAMGRGDAVMTWYIAKRDFSFKRPSPDLRARRAKLPDSLDLLDEYYMLLDQIGNLLPRRSRSTLITKEEFRCLRDLLPELGWRKISNSMGATPSKTAHKVLGKRYEVGVKRVVRALAEGRRKHPPSSM